MGNFFARNINRRGRIVRAVSGLALVIAGVLLSGRGGWVCLLLVALGVFALYEAARGWCVVRACGIKTKL
jgi:O-antigen ligase